MDSKDRLISLLKTIELQTGKDARAIALEMGYKKYYISDMLTPTGKVSDKFINGLERQYLGNSEANQELITVPTGLTVKDYIALQREFIEYAKAMAINLNFAFSDRPGTLPQNHKAGNPQNEHKPEPQRTEAERMVDSQTQDSVALMKRKRQEAKDRKGSSKDKT